MNEAASIFDELRMLVAIGQQPEVWILSDTDEQVGKYVNVDAAIEDGSVVIRGDYRPATAFYAAGALLVLPSERTITLPFDVPNDVPAGQWLRINGTIGVDHGEDT